MNHEQVADFAVAPPGDLGARHARVVDVVLGHNIVTTAQLRQLARPTGTPR